MTREYRFTIPVLPPSVNALHNVIWSQRKVVLKPEVLRFRSDASAFVPRMEFTDGSLIRVDTIFYYHFYHQNGKLRVFDTHNAVKPTLDLIAWKIGVNDNRFKAGSWDSVDSADEKVEVTLREVCATDDQRTKRVAGEG